MKLEWQPSGVEWVKERGRWVAIVHDAPYAVDADNPLVKTQHLDDGIAVFVEKYGPDLPPASLMMHVGHAGEFTEIGDRVEFQLGEEPSSLP